MSREEAGGDAAHDEMLSFVSPPRARASPASSITESGNIAFSSTGHRARTVYADARTSIKLRAAPDILGIAGAFGPVLPIDQPLQGEVGPKMTGSIPGWAKTQGDNIVTVVHDILGMAAQFGHNC